MYTFEGLHRPVRNPTFKIVNCLDTCWYTCSLVRADLSSCSLSVHNVSRGPDKSHTLPLTLGPVIPPDPTVVCMIVARTFLIVVTQWSSPSTTLPVTSADLWPRHCQQAFGLPDHNHCLTCWSCIAYIHPSCSSSVQTCIIIFHWYGWVAGAIKFGSGQTFPRHIPRTQWLAAAHSLCSAI